MISTLIFLGCLVAAVLIALKTRDKMYVETTDRWNDTVEKFQPSWLIKPLTIFIVGMFASIIQPYSIEKIDAGHKGLKINLIGNQRGVSSYQYKTGWVVYNSWTEQVLEFTTY